MTNYRYPPELWAGPVKGAGLIPYDGGSVYATAITLDTIASYVTGGTNIASMGAIGDGASHPAATRYASLAALQVVYPFAASLAQELDWLALQAALNAGGLVQLSGTCSYVMSNANPASMTPLVIVSGQSWIEGYGAKLDFTATAPIANTEHLVSDYGFTTANAGEWQNATIYGPTGVNPVVITGNGQAVTTDSTYAGISFSQWGQQVTMPPGNYRALITLSGTVGASFATGDVNPPYAAMSFFANSPGDGGNFTGKQVSASFTLPAVVTPGASLGPAQVLEFDFNVSATTTAWLTFSGGGYGNFTVTSMDIIPFIPNTAIWCTRDGGIEHYPIARPVRGLEIVGNSQLGYGPDGFTPLGLTGVLYQSLVEDDGNLVSFAECTISGFGAALLLRDGAYLMEWRNVMIDGNDCGVFFPTGTLNAGENNRFYGGGIYNNGYGILNPGGGEFTLYGTALDYCWHPIGYNASRIELYGCHVENQLSNAPLFHCSAGQITMFGGMILGVGTAAEAPAAPIRLDTSNAMMQCFGTQLYLIGDAAGMSVDGPGTWRNYGWINTGNPSIQQPGTAPVMDPLGGAGNFQPPSDVPFLGLDPSGIYLQGGIYSNNPATVVTNRWTTDAMTLALSTAHFHSGTRSVLATKTAGAGTDYQIVFMIPVTRGHDVSLSFWWLAPNVVTAAAAVASLTSAGGLATLTANAPHGLTGTNWVYVLGATQTQYNGLVFVTVISTTAFTYTVKGGPSSPATGTITFSYTADLYARLYWAQQIGLDTYGRPVFGGTATYKGELDIPLPLAGSATWTAASYGTQYNPATIDPSQNDGPGAPVWATHCALLLDTESLPAMSFYLDDFSVYVI